MVTTVLPPSLNLKKPNKLVYQKFSAVVPSYNENPRFVRVLNELLKTQNLDELIFVDDGSNDGTQEAIKQFKNDSRFVYIRHEKNKGKGRALKTGVEKARNEVILFLDADLSNITSQKIYKIAEPVLKDEVDMARGSFSRKRGRVTEFAVKPMMEILFPSLYFDQPISGQICAKKSFLMKAEFTERYGVDIGLLFDAIEDGQRIIEVDIGRLVNRENSAETVKEMSRQVLETMISRAGLIRHKYKLVMFTLDNTLINERSFSQFLKQLGIEDKIIENHKLMEKGEITAKEYLERNVKLFTGIKISTVKELCNKLPTVKYAKEVIKALVRRKYIVGIISSNFSPVVESYAKRLGTHFWNGVELEEKNGKYTGRIKKKSNDWLHNDFSQGFSMAFNKAIKTQRTTATETIMVAGNEKSMEAFKAAGLSVAYKPKIKELKLVADKTIHVLAELLAIIE
jgi:HAD superfamily phosphoserine phosphatase-like hydrolase